MIRVLISYLEILRIGTIILLTVGYSVFSAGWSLVIPLSPFIMSRVFNAPPYLYSAVFGSSMLAMGIGQYILGPFIDKFGGGRVLLLSSIISTSITLAISLFAVDTQMYVIPLLLFALVSSAGTPSLNYIATKCVNSEVVSVAVSIPWTFTYLASVSGFLGGPLIESYGVSLTYLLVSVVQFIGVIILFKLPE